MVDAEGRSASSQSADELWRVPQLLTFTVRNTNIQQVWVQACPCCKIRAKLRLLSACKLILWKQCHKQRRRYLSYVAVDEIHQMNLLAVRCRKGIPTKLVRTLRYVVFDRRLQQMLKRCQRTKIFKADAASYISICPPLAVQHAYLFF